MIGGEIDGRDRSARIHHGEERASPGLAFLPDDKDGRSRIARDAVVRVLYAREPLGRRRSVVKRIAAALEKNYRKKTTFNYY